MGNQGFSPLVWISFQSWSGP